MQSIQWKKIIQNFKAKNPKDWQTNLFFLNYILRSCIFVRCTTVIGNGFNKVEAIKMCPFTSPKCTLSITNFHTYKPLFSS